MQHGSPPPGGQPEDSGGWTGGGGGWCVELSNKVEGASPPTLLIQLTLHLRPRPKMIIDEFIYDNKVENCSLKSCCS